MLLVIAGRHQEGKVQTTTPKQTESPSKGIGLETLILTKGTGAIRRSWSSNSEGCNCEPTRAIMIYSVKLRALMEPETIKQYLIMHLIDMYMHTWIYNPNINHPKKHKLGANYKKTLGTRTERL